MIELLDNRLAELNRLRESLSREVAGFYGSDEFFATDERDQFGLEHRRGIPPLRLKLWETFRRLNVVRDAIIRSKGDLETSIKILETRAQDAKTKLAKGILSDSSRAERMEFLALGVEITECDGLLAFLIPLYGVTHARTAQDDSNMPEEDRNIHSKQSRKK